MFAVPKTKPKIGSCPIAVSRCPKDLPPPAKAPGLLTFASNGTGFYHMWARDGLEIRLCRSECSLCCLLPCAL